MLFSEFIFFNKRAALEESSAAMARGGCCCFTGTFLFLASILVVLLCKEEFRVCGVDSVLAHVHVLYLFLQW